MISVLDNGKARRNVSMNFNQLPILMGNGPWVKDYGRGTIIDSLDSRLR